MNAYGMFSDCIQRKSGKMQSDNKALDMGIPAAATSLRKVKDMRLN